MIETFFLDWGFAFGTGLVFGLAGRRSIAAGMTLAQTRAFRWGLAYLNLAILPVSVTLYLWRPDWMWMYWVRDAVVPVAVVVLAFAMYEVAFLGGIALAREIALAPARARWIAGGAVGALITAAEIAARHRLFHFGTADEYASGAAAPAFVSGRVAPEIWLLALAGLAAVVAFAALTFTIARNDRDRVDLEQPAVA